MTITVVLLRHWRRDFSVGDCKSVEWVGRGN